MAAPGWEPGYGAPAGGGPAAPDAAPAPAPVPAGAAYSAPGYGATPAGYGVPAPGWEGDPGPDDPWASAATGPDGPHEDPYAPAPQGTGTGGGEAYAAAPQEDPYAAAPQGEGRTCVACRAGHVDTDGYCEHCGHAQPRERDHLEEELCSVAAVSDRGLRHHRNEDSFAVSATALPDGSAATVAIVCDGVSSASRPDEASAAAAGAANEALLEALPRGADPVEAMHGAILAAAAAVTALAPPAPGAQNAPACTLVGAVVSGGVLTIGWVGDSRAYWVPDDRAALARRLTEDDSWAAQMVAAGLMGEAEAYADVRAHAITGWLGADAYDLEPHTASFRPDHPGVVVVCTDGLWNYAESAREMAQVLPADAADRPLHSAQVLVGHALDGGGHDNITVAVVPFAGPAQPHAQTEAEPEAEPQARPRA
ncbi:PP2C family protein-serine/threonine phosphatase [Streptomyces sp. NPDC058734]|uniref:PP2C family protein-serine/threonine phosphatase n=1 Tax=Streptomyces sp. NPDC058734 TaxID=3346615 RepID=UPI0036B8F1CB